MNSSLSLKIFTIQNASFSRMKSGDYFKLHANLLAVENCSVLGVSTDLKEIGKKTFSDTLRFISSFHFNFESIN